MGPIRLFLALLATVAALAPAPAAFAQTYEYEGEAGDPAYTDNPYEAGITTDHPTPAIRLDFTSSPIGEAPPPLAEKPADEREKGVTLTGDPTYGFTREGFTQVTATLTNETPNPVIGVAVTLELYDADQRLLDTVVLTPTEPSQRIDAGGRVVVVAVAATDPGIIAGHKYQVTWANMHKNVPTPIPTVEPTPTPAPRITEEELPDSRTARKRLLRRLERERLEEEGR
jgi:hypothetical protein